MEGEKRLLAEMERININIKYYQKQIEEVVENQRKNFLVLYLYIQIIVLKKILKSLTGMKYQKVKFL